VDSEWLFVEWLVAKELGRRSYQLLTGNQ